MRFKWWHGPKFRLWYEKYMLIVGLLGGLLFYFQALKIYLYQSAKDLSLPGFILAFISLLSWLIYGMIRQDRVLIIVNISGVIGAGLVLALKFWADGGMVL